MQEQAWRFQSAEAAAAAYSQQLRDSSPWPDWYPPQQVTLPVGTRFQMALSKGQEADRPGGFGLTAMRSRARELGGSLTIETSPGDGTVVAVRIPDHDEDETEQVPPARAPQHQEDR